MDISRKLAAVAALSILISGASFASTDGALAKRPVFQMSSDTATKLMSAVRIASSKLRTGDIKGAEADFIKISQAPSLSNASVQLRYVVYALLAACELAKGHSTAYLKGARSIDMRIYSVAGYLVGLGLAFVSLKTVLSDWYLNERLVYLASALAGGIIGQVLAWRKWRTLLRMSK